MPQPPLKRTKDLLSGPAFANRQTVDEPGKKNLKLEVQENHVPHAQLATQNVISRHKDPALDVKIQESQKEAAIL
jgi:hypothetical protein